MKKLLFMLLAFLPLSIWADPVKIGDLYYELDEASCTATVTCHPNEGGYSGDIVIPSTVNYGGTTYSVTNIMGDGGAFGNCINLTSISIPNSMTTIGENAFWNCSSLTSIIIPESVTSIENAAFMDCSSLVSISIPANAYYGDMVFDGCTSLPVVDNLRYADALVVDVVDKTKSTYIIKDGTKIIYNSAFADCTNLTNITLPNSLKHICYNAFRNCTSLISINIPSSITRITDDPFEGCSSLPVEKNIRYADTYLVEVVDKSLSDYQIKEGTRFIGSHAFQECSLSSIYIPNSVMNIGSQAFYESNNLTTIICSATTPPVCEDLAFDNFDLSQMELLVPASSINTYRATYPWSEFGKIQPINIDITIGSTGYATYCSEYDLDFNNITDFKAYIVVGYNKNSGNVTVVSVKDAPAGTGLLLKGISGTYQVPYGESGSIYSNMLVGVTEETIINATDGTYTNFTLQNGSKGVGFYAIMDNHKMAAHRAYLQIPNNMLSNSANQVGLEFEEGMTSINETNMVEDGNAIWFSLDGRQFNSKPTKKGVYVTNGRKVVIK